MPESILAGTAVLDLSEGLPAAFAGRILAEAGADVVKIEPPGGDRLRASAPAAFASWNRSKRSVTLDLTSAPDRDRLDDLLARADVLLHDRPSSVRARLGLQTDDLARRFPHLIVGAVTGYPPGHPHADSEPIEILVQAAAGLMDEQQGNRPGPIFTRMPYGSWCAAFLVTVGVLARMVQRERTGVVGAVETSLLQGALVPTALFWQRSERLPAAIEQPHTLPKVWPGASLSLFECGDGEWVQLAGSLGGWIESPPVLETLAEHDRVELSDEGVTPGNRERWQQIFKFRSSASWIEAFGAADVPCTLVRDLGDCFDDEQARVNGYVVEVDDPAIGHTLQAASPVRTAPPCRVVGPAPRLESASFDGFDQVRNSFGHTSHRPNLVAAGQSSADALAGLRVLDFGSMIAGPFGAQCLGDFGAEVIKIEGLRGDRGRGLTQFAGANRGKQSVAIDLKNPHSADVLNRLLGSADVVIHNIRAGAALRLGLDPESLRRANDRIVFSHVSANGLRGPMAEYPGYDPTAQAMTGWERANVGAGQPPMWMRNSVLDVGTGLMSSVGALLGLYQRERTGVAGDCATSLLAVGLAIASETALRLPEREPIPVRQIDPGQTGLSSLHRIYEVADGWVAIAADTEPAKAGLHTVTGASGAAIAAAVRDRSSVELLQTLRSAGIPACAVALNQMDAFFDDAYNRRHGLCRHLQAADYGEVDVVGGFWTLGDTADAADGNRVRACTESIPALGADTAAVLTGLDLTERDIADLVAFGALNTGRPQ